MLTDAESQVIELQEQTRYLDKEVNHMRANKSFFERNYRTAIDDIKELRQERDELKSKLSDDNWF
jgi:uncharacterized coiled-coil DUF342 family protein